MLRTILGSPLSLIIMSGTRTRILHPGSKPAKKEIPEITIIVCRDPSVDILGHTTVNHL